MELVEIVERCRASQNKKELLHLLKQVEKINPKVILEIGSWRGWLLETLKQAFPEVKLIGIEVDQNNVDIGLADDLLPIIADSGTPECWDKIVNELNGQQIDFLFIDGNHLYEAVKKDFLLYHQLVRKGGIIAFHDVHIEDNDTVEVYKFWDEVKEKYESEEIVGEKGTGTGILYT